MDKSPLLFLFITGSRQSAGSSQQTKQFGLCVCFSSQRISNETLFSSKQQTSILNRQISNIKYYNILIFGAYLEEGTLALEVYTVQVKHFFLIQGITLWFCVAFF